MRIPGPRIASLVLTLALLVGHGGAVCAGWAATPEARMACCSDDGMCPMREGAAAHGAGSQRVLTQSQADGCCAASEREDSGPSAPVVAATISQAVLGTALVLPPRPPALVLGNAWRTVVPIPERPVPRHLLLSVFLV